MKERSLAEKRLFREDDFLQLCAETSESMVEAGG